MHLMRFKIDNKPMRDFFKNSIHAITAMVLLMLLASSTNTFAVSPVNEKNNAPANKAKPLVAEKVSTSEAVIQKPRLLFAESTPIKREIHVIDSLMFEQELDEEGFPADDLYQTWNNKYVNPYSSLAMPDSFAIDLTSVVMPIDDESIRITSPFGPRKRRMHRGIDLKVQVGDTIRAVCDGKVRIQNYERRGYGYYLVLRHPNGLETVYGHLSKFLVEEEQNVKMGQAIALGGNTGRSTGSHLHFETRFFGEAINPAEMFDFHNKVMQEDVYVFNKTKTPVNKYTGKGTAKITYHRIKQGETLSTIARKHGLSISQLCKLNNISPKTTIRAGRSLRCS